MVTLVVNDLPLLGANRRETVAGQAKRVAIVYKAACPTCRLTLPLFETLYRRSEGALDIVAVSQDEPAETASFVRESKITMPVLIDFPAYAFSASLGTRSVPMIVELEARVIHSVCEGYNRKELEAIVLRLVHGEDLGWDPTTVFADPDLPLHKPG